MMGELQVQEVNENKENKKKQKMEYVIEGNVAVFRTKSGVEFMVDLEDAEMVSQYRWHVTGGGYLQGNVTGKPVYLHRFILGLLDSDYKVFVDHINHDKTNNCKGNLRVCTNQENQRNTNAKGYTKLPNGEYKAQICVDGKVINLGYYNTAEHARAVRIMAEKQYYGEFSSKTDLFDDPEIKRLYEEAMASIDKYRYQNKARIEGDVVYVTASYRDVSKEFVVDVIDYEKIKEFKWRIGAKGQIVTDINGESQTLARVLLGLKRGDKTKRVKFIDKNRFNFRRENLKVIECKTKNQD